MPQLVTPKFLTPANAQLAVEATIESLYGTATNVSRLANVLKPKRAQLHAVILVPGMLDERPEYPSWPNYPIVPVTIYEHTLGNKDEFKYPFDDIARCKALQLWQDRNDDRTDIMPHLLFPGDAPFWGGVKRNGIVVACSGIQPWIDKMVSGVTADTFVALAHNEWENSPDKADDELCFLT